MPNALPETRMDSLSTEIERLGERIAAAPGDAALYVERGKLYWRKQDVPRCMADYDAAVRLDPRSEARQLKTMVRDILAFYHKDMYNP